MRPASNPGLAMEQKIRELEARLADERADAKMLSELLHRH